MRSVNERRYQEAILHNDPDDMIAIPDIKWPVAAEHGGERMGDNSLGRSRPKLVGKIDAELSGNETVLVVDDEPVMRELTTEILRRFGYRVLEAADALEAQRLANAKEKINLLLTDHRMPETSGLELVRWFRRNCPETKVLITTGSWWELENLLGDGERIAILPKPFDHLQLGRMVRLILG